MIGIARSSRMLAVCLGSKRGPPVEVGWTKVQRAPCPRYPLQHITRREARTLNLEISTIVKVSRASQLCQPGIHRADGGIGWALKICMQKF